jgi:hypothetical protein
MADAPGKINELVCDECGRFGAMEFGERNICPDCYEHCGSCCPEFGREKPEQDSTAQE